MTTTPQAAMDINAATPNIDAPRVLGAPQAALLSALADLHGAIMNLPCVPQNMDSEPNQRLAYKVGHRDARHAAAEPVLARAALSARKPLTVSLANRIGELVMQHGSLRAVARVTRIDVGYLSRLESGEKTNPSADVLASLGLCEVPVTYERINGLEVKHADQA